MHVIEIAYGELANRLQQQVLNAPRRHIFRSELCLSSCKGLSTAWEDEVSLVTKGAQKTIKQYVGYALVYGNMDVPERMRQSKNYYGFSCTAGVFAA
eukprot:10564669-Karenia_brevis.AAC.1